MRWSSILAGSLVLATPLVQPIQAQVREPTREQSMVPELVPEITHEPGVQTDLRPTGSLVGSILSKFGGRLPGATVTLTEKTTGKTYEVVSGEMGIIRITRLEEGNYEVRVELTGFMPTVVHGLLIRSGDSQT